MALEFLNGDTDTFFIIEAGSTTLRCYWSLIPVIILSDGFVVIIGDPGPYCKESILSILFNASSLNLFAPSPKEFYNKVPRSSIKGWSSWTFSIGEGVLPSI